MAKQRQPQAAWHGSNLAVVVERDGRLVGCLQALTDGTVTLYICELLVEKKMRGSGIGKKLMDHVHSL